jgi:N-methylhydantoinase A
VLVPPRPGIASALGLLVADLKHDYAVTRLEKLSEADPLTLEQQFQMLEAPGRAALVRESVPEARMRFERAIDLRYVGQSYHLTMSLGSGPVTGEMLAEARQRFNDAHFTTYGYAEPGEPCELVNLRVSAVGLIRTPRLATRPVGAGGGDARTGVRAVWFPQTGFADCAVFDRLRLAPAEAFEGPAVVEDPDATTLVHPGWRCTVGPRDILVIERVG